MNATTNKQTAQGFAAAVNVAEDAPEPLQIAELLQNLTAGVLQPQKVGDATFVTLPPNYSHADITQAVEKAAPTPARKRGTVLLHDVASLIAYAQDQQQTAAGYVYADIDARTICAVFNDQKGAPGWRDHRAQFQAEFTTEFKLWMQKNKQPMGQGEFAEFIEDNIADLQGTEGANLLTVATTIQASTGIAFSSARRLQDGQTQLTYNETIDAKAGADGALKIPQVFELGLRIFKNGAGYKLKARLKYRLASGSVKLWYELDRPERAVEDAFGEYVATVREQSGYQVLIGKAG